MTESVEFQEFLMTESVEFQEFRNSWNSWNSSVSTVTHQTVTARSPIRHLFR